MGWVINTIIKILLTAVCGLFKNIAADFITDFGINIGAEFPKIGESSSLAKVLSSYNTSYPSVFDTIFPMQSFKTLFVGLALVIATALLIKELILATATPMLGQRQNALISVLKYMGTVAGIVLSYRIFIVAEYIMNEFYIKFGKAAIDIMNTQAGGGNALEIIGNNGSAGDSVASAGLEAGLLMSSFTVNPAVGVGEGIAELILNLIIVWLLLTGFLKLVLEILERYIVLGALFYTSPLAFSSLPSNDTSDIFKSWVRMSLSEMLLMIMNSVCISVFLGALANLSKVGTLTVGGGAVEGSSMLINNRFSWMVYMLLLIAWLQFSQRLDSYMNSLGLSTAQTGGALGASVLAGAATAVGIGRAVGSGIKGTGVYKAMKNAPMGFGKAAAGADALKDSAKSIPQKLSNATGGKTDAAFSARRLDEAKAAMASQQSRVDSERFGKSLQKAGEDTAGTAIRQQRNMEGSLAQSTAAKLASQHGDSKLQDSISGANAGSFKFSKDQDGVYGFSYKDSKGQDLRVSLGGDESRGAIAGGAGESKLRVSGTSDAMQSFVGERAMRDAARGETFGKPEFAAGMVGNTHAIHNQTTGESYKVFAPGSTNIPAGAKSMDNGYYVSSTPMAKSAGSPSFTSYRAMDNISSEQSKLWASMDTHGYNALASAMTGGALNAFTPHMDNLIDAMGIKNSMVQNALRPLESAGGSASWDGDSKVMVNTPDGGAIACDLFNPDAPGSSIDNYTGVSMKWSLVDRGDNGEALQSMITATDLRPQQKWANALVGQLNATEPDKSSGGNQFTMLMPKELPVDASGTLPDVPPLATYTLQSNGETVAYITDPCFVAQGCFGDNWRIDERGEHAILFLPGFEEYYGNKVFGFTNEAYANQQDYVPE